MEVLLRGCPSTGCQWEVAGLDRGVLELVQTDYEDDQPMLIGGCGTHKFTFMAVASGQSPLLLVYRRHGDTDPFAQFTATVDVGP